MRIAQMIGMGIGIVLVLSIMITVLGEFYNIEEEKKQNLEEIGFYITDEERQCYDVCDGNYFYSPGAVFRSTECECGVTE